MAIAVTLRRVSANVPLPHESSRATPFVAEVTQSRSRASPLMPAVQAIGAEVCTSTRWTRTPLAKTFSP